MSKRYVKTAAGHAEIQAKALALSRPVRNLLLVINDSQPAQAWLQQIHGLADTDLATLLDAGLIAEATPAGAAAAGPLQDALRCIESTAYTPLYDTLTAQAKGQLGLMKGYRFTLEVERAADLAALRALARRFIQGLHAEHGPAAVRQFIEALRAGG